MIFIYLLLISFKKASKMMCESMEKLCKISKTDEIEGSLRLF